MNLLRPFAACLVLATTAACEGARLPSMYGAPTPLPAPTPPAPAPDLAPPVLAGATAPTSTLGVTRLEVVPPQGTSWISYHVSLTLTELGGQSGAWIRSMEVRAEGGEPETDCPWKNFRIPPGGVWDSSRLSYCQPYSFNPRPASQLTVTVAYTDDDGRPGFLERVVALTP